MRRVHPLLILTAGALLLTAACLALLWQWSGPAATVVHANGTALDRTMPARPIPPAPAPHPPAQLPAPPPDDMLTDLAGVLVASHSATDIDNLNMPALIARYVPDDPAPLPPTLLSLGYYMTAEPLVQRMVWHAHQHGPDHNATLAAAARSARTLAGCTPADQTPNCRSTMALLATLAPGPGDVAGLQATAQTLLLDFAARLDRVAAGR